MLLMHVSEACRLGSYITLLRLELQRSQSRLDKNCVVTGFILHISRYAGVFFHLVVVEFHI